MTSSNQLKQVVSIEQQIVVTIRGRKRCPLCNNPLLEVLRLWGDIEEYCTSWKETGIKCKYFNLNEVSSLSSTTLKRRVSSEHVL